MKKISLCVSVEFACLDLSFGRCAFQNKRRRNASIQR